MKSKMPGLLALGVTLLLFALLTASASAVGEPITISPTSGPPGTTVTVNGSGWQGYSDVPIQIDGKTLATAHPDANGNFSVRITIPKDATPGSKVRIDALYGNGGSANAWFNVTEGSPGSGGGIDLEVTKIDPLGQRICAGSKVTFRASIRNNGSTESGFFNIRWIADNTKRFDGGHYSIPASATDTHDHIWKNVPAGKHTLEFIADFDKQKSETNENNNQSTLPFTALDCSTGQQFEFPWDDSKTLAYTGGPHVWTGKNWSGLDFASEKKSTQSGSEPTHILAMADGKVTYVGNKVAGCPNCNVVKVSHDNGWDVWYVHLSSFAADIKRQWNDPANPHQPIPVKQGRYLGNEGMTGANQPHIHIELRKGDTPYEWSEVSGGIEGWEFHRNCDGYDKSKAAYDEKKQKAPPPKDARQNQACKAYDNDGYNYDGYMSKGNTHAIPWDDSSDPRYWVHSNNDEL